MTNYREQERKQKLAIKLKKRNVTLVSPEYTNANAYYNFTCDICGEHFNKTAYLATTQDYPCPKCTVKAKAKRHREKVKERFTKRFMELGLDKEFEIFEIPELIKYPAKFIHKPCGHVITTSLQNLSRVAKNLKGTGTGCKYCSGTHTYTESEITAYFAQERPNYTFIKSYMNDRHHLHVVFKHNPCGTERDMQFNVLLRGQGCRHCKQSGGEEMIAYTLDTLGVTYEQEKTFEGLLTATGQLKRVDFYLPDYNIAIEYDGVQHFNAIDSWGGERYLEKNRLTDSVTNEYFKQGSSSLYRIPYTIVGQELRLLIAKIVEADKDADKFKV